MRHTLVSLFSGVLLVVLLYGIARQQYIGTILEKTAETTISIIDGMNQKLDRRLLQKCLNLFIARIPLPFQKRWRAPIRTV